MKEHFARLIHSSVVLAVFVCSAVWADEGFLNTWAPEPLVEIKRAQVASLQAQAEDSSVCGSADFAHEVVELTNIERFQNGALPPLKAEMHLIDASYLHSVNMAERNFFAHCDLDTKKLPWDRMRDAGYYWSWAGENIAAGYGTPASVTLGWMSSSGHRANILNAEFREIGVGYYYYASDTPDTRRDSDGDCEADSQANGSYYRYWTQNFGTRNSVYPVIINLEAHMTDSREVGLYVYGEGWAAEMRIRNNEGDWSPWVPYASENSWMLDSGSGTQTVMVELRSANGTVRSASDEICLETDEPVLFHELIFRDGFE